jgi:hypothetical protein
VRDDPVHVFRVIAEHFAEDGVGDEGGGLKEFSGCLFGREPLSGEP